MNLCNNCVLSSQYNVFDPVPEKMFPVGHWSKRRLREETQRLQKILEILLSRQSSDSRAENSELAEKSRKLSSEMWREEGDVDNVRAALLTLSSETGSRLVGAERKIWHVGNLTAAGQHEEAEFVSAAWRQLMNHTAQLDQNDFAERRSISALLDGAAQVRNVGLESTARYLADVEQRQTLVSHGIQSLGAGFLGQAGDLEGQARALQSRLENLQARLAIDERSASHEAVMLFGAAKSEASVLAADAETIAHSAAEASATRTTLDFAETEVARIDSAAAALLTRVSNSTKQLTEALTPVSEQIAGLRADADERKSQIDATVAELSALDANQTALGQRAEDLRRDAVRAAAAARARLPAAAALAARVGRAGTDIAERLRRMDVAADALAARLRQMGGKVEDRSSALSQMEDDLAMVEAAEEALRQELPQQRSAAADAVSAVKIEAQALDEAASPVVRRFEQNVRSALPALNLEARSVQARAVASSRKLPTAVDSAAARLLARMRAARAVAAQSRSAVRAAAAAAEALGTAVVQAEARRVASAADADAAKAGADSLSDAVAAGALNTDRELTSAAETLQAAAGAAARVKAMVRQASRAADEAAANASAVRAAVGDAEGREAAEGRDFAGLRAAAAAAAAADNMSLTQLQASMKRHPPLLALVNLL